MFVPINRKWLITLACEGHEDHCVCDGLEEAIDEIREVFGVTTAQTMGAQIGERIAGYKFPAFGAEAKILRSSKAQGGSGCIRTDGEPLQDTLTLSQIDIADRTWFGTLTRSTK